MRIEIDLEGIERYFEYIPKELINSVVLSLLHEAVQQRIKMKVDKPSTTTSELEEMLSRLLSQQPIEQSVQVSEPTNFKETVIDDVELDDLSDFMDFMK